MKSWVALGASVLGAGLALSPAGAAHAAGATGAGTGYTTSAVAAPTGETIYDGPGASGSAGSASAAALPSPNSAIATANQTLFNFTFVNTTSQQQVPFQAAAGILANLLVTPPGFDIDVTVTFAALPAHVLGSGGPGWVGEFTNDHTLIPGALFNFLLNDDVVDSQPEISMTFTTTPDDPFYLGTDGNTPFNQIDLESVVLHELSHGLGMGTTFRVSGSTGLYGSSFQGRQDPFLFDRFVTDNAGNVLTSKFAATGAPALKTALESGSLFFDGTMATGADVAAHGAGDHGGKGPRLYAPGPFEQGSSVAHVNSNTYNGTGDALMTPGITSGEAQHSTGPVLNGILADLGWEVGGILPNIRHQGYWIGSSDGDVAAFGEAPALGRALAPSTDKAVTLVARPQGDGYWVISAKGNIAEFGNAPAFPGFGALNLNRPIVTAAATPSGNGLWLVGSDGGIFTQGDASFHGSAAGIPLNRPIIGIAATATGQGYLLFASDGGVFANAVNGAPFGDAKFLGSLGDVVLNQPIVTVVTTPGAQGYLMVAADGGAFASNKQNQPFGNAKFFGSAVGVTTSPIVGITPTPSSNGYWIVAADGGVLASDKQGQAFGDALFLGSMAGHIAVGSRATGIAAA